MAADAARGGTGGAGDLYWSDTPHSLDFALITEPDVPGSHCGELLFIAMLAFGDAAGALGPPELAVQYSWPGILRLNGARAGEASLLLPPTPKEATPEWMVLSLQADIGTGSGDAPGLDPGNTSFLEEGCAGLTPALLLEATARHLVSAIHAWESEGFRRVHQSWWERRYPDAPLDSRLTGELTGLDEHGNALLRHGSGPSGLDTIEILAGLRMPENNGEAS